jgi:transcriptional regulator with XRE-family HTH domain
MNYEMNGVTNEWWNLGWQRHRFVSAPLSESWLLLWEEQHRMQPIMEASRFSPTATFEGVIELPYELLWSIPSPRTIPEDLKLIEQALGVTVKEVAQVLRVSRPMIYHWRAGMEPFPENRARIDAVARLAVDWTHLDQTPIGQRLHSKQAEGSTLMDLLSSQVLDVPAIRMVMKRLVGTQKVGGSEIAVREALLRSIAEGEAASTRSDIVQERKAAGKPSYIGDAKNMGKLIEIQPDGTRRSGRMVKRKFVPDDAE